MREEGGRGKERERVRGTEIKKTIKYMYMQLSFSACTCTYLVYHQLIPKSLYQPREIYLIKNYPPLNTHTHTVHE